MEARRRLSPDQKATLESVYLLFRTTRPLLDMLRSQTMLSDVDRMQLQSIARLLLLNESRLVEHFPEVKTFEEKWEKRK